jgi:hypothetical protein
MIAWLAWPVTQTRIHIKVEGLRMREIGTIYNALQGEICGRQETMAADLILLYICINIISNRHIFDIHNPIRTMA